MSGYGRTIVFEGVNESGNVFRRFRGKLAAGRWAAIEAPRLAAAIRREAPVGDDRGGKLRDATKVSIENSMAGVRLVYTAPHVPYAPYVIHGTKPHMIFPSAASRLHWKAQGGEDVFARAVRHPGTKPNNFPERAARKMLGELSASMAVVIKQSMQK